MWRTRVGEPRVRKNTGLALAGSQNVFFPESQGKAGRRAESGTCPSVRSDCEMLYAALLPVR